MKRFLIPAAIILLYLSACQDSITVFIEKEPGAVAGVIHPADAEATIGLYQEVLIAETTVDSQGGFRLNDITPGVYTLKVTADGYGMLIRNNITVKEDETNYIGDLILSGLPWPMRSVEPAWGDTLESAGVKIMIRFRTDIVNATVEDAFTINPEVENLTMSVSYVSGGDMLVIEGDFSLGTTYTYTIDTTLNSYIEQPLEFPFTSSFTTMPFKITSTTLPPNNTYSFSIEFNSPVFQDQLLPHLTIIPETEVELGWRGRTRRSNVSYELASLEQTRFGIVPKLVWIPGTTTITIDGDLAEVNGVTLGADVSFSFEMDSLSVTDTRPYDGQHFVETDDYIRITFNTLVNESTVESSISLSPPHAMDFSTYSSHITSVSISPDTLFSSTTYTVSIDTTIRDIWGGGMSETYSFTFGTE
jgi:hypothetical protein